MRLGATFDGGDPLTMSATGNDYAELCDLGPSRWSSRSYHSPQGASIHSTHPQSSSSNIGVGAPGLSHSSHHHHPDSYEIDDIGGALSILSPPSGPSISAGGPYGISTRIGNSTSSLRGGRSGLYYSPPGTSYTIVERPHSPHYYYNTAGVPSKGGSLPGRGSSYYQPSSTSHIPGSLIGATGSSGGSNSAGALHNTSRHNGKKRPISPEQVLRMFGATTSSSVPTSYHYSNGTRDRGGRRSPASSPPSTTHQVCSKILISSTNVNTNS